MSWANRHPRECVLFDWKGVDGSNFKRSDTHTHTQLWERDRRCIWKWRVCEPECRYKVKIVSGTSSWYHFNHFVCLPILSFSPIYSNSFSWNVALKPAKSELFIWWSMATWETPNWDQLPEGGWWQAVCGPDLIKELEWPVTGVYYIYSIWEILNPSFVGKRIGEIMRDLYKSGSPQVGVLVYPDVVELERWL